MPPYISSVLSLVLGRMYSENIHRKVSQGNAVVKCMKAFKCNIYNYYLLKTNLDVQYILYVILSHQPTSVVLVLLGGL